MKKNISMLLICSMLFSLPLQVQGAEKTETETTTEEETQEETVPTLTLDEAIKIGLENSLTMEKVNNQAKITSLVNKNSSDTKKDLDEAESKLLDAESSIYSGRKKIYSSMDQLDSAQSALDNGIAPETITLPNGTVIPKGTDISSMPAVIAAIQKNLDDSKRQLNSSLKDLDEGNSKYLANQAKYEATLQFAMANISNKLSTSTITSLDPTYMGNLIKEMAKVQDRVTNYATNIYKNQIALLIQNSYFEALKQNKLLETKEKAMERGKLQFEFADYAYEVGAKSKDDRNLAKMYYDSTVMAYDLQVKEANNAMLELKKNMNIPLETPLQLEEVPLDLEKGFDLQKGIDSGLRARLEVKKAYANVEIYNALKTAVEYSNYKENDNEYQEASLLLEQARLELKDAKLQVETSIRTSYETVTAMEKVAKKSLGLKANAEETLEIAKLKYEVGFGADNALLKQLNLQDVSGTMVEVIAAEENLTSVEEKMIEATNGYLLARAKYLNDIGILPY
ncbi:MAG: TolC family protein [Epulopiscium sp.]|jgi:hypothetical protein|nr:TolC family protein [Candidatus Epulonipiscium sp.]